MHHHTPERDRRHAVEALDDERRGDLVREVRHELRRRRLEPGEAQLERVAEEKLDVFPSAETVRKRLLERPVQLDRLDVPDPVREKVREDAEARPDLQHDVVGAQFREPSDHPEDVPVDQEVLAELLLRKRPGHASENALAAFSSSRRPSAAASSPRASARALTVWTTFAGSFGRPLRGWGLR